MNRAFVSGQRFALVATCILFGFSVIFGRLFYLHVLKQSEYSQIAEQNRNRFQVLESRRGDIVDCNNNLLATSKEVRELGVDPQMVGEVDAAALNKLAGYLNVSVNWLRQRFETKRYSNGRDIRWCKLADAVDEKVYQEILQIGIKGVYGNSKYTRYYPGKSLAAHIVGYINRNGPKGQAVMGVEQYLDFYLRGQDGWRESEKDGRRREIIEFRNREIEPADGYHVQLTLDMLIQHMVEEELSRLAEEYRPVSASIIVSDPTTGFVLAMGNYPSFDPNEYSKYPLENQRNRAVTDVFEPGSTFKIVAAAGALNERLVRPFDTIDCDIAEVNYHGRNLKLPNDHNKLGVLSVEDIVAKSSNRGAAQLGMLLQEEGLYHYASLFGFGKKTTLGLTGETSGVLHPVDRWDGLMITRIPMGHAVSATPLQVHQAMGVIANGGLAMKPQVIRKIFNEGGQPVHVFYPKVTERVVSVATATTVAQMLNKVVGPEGTARRAFIDGYGVAGKTGTTQKIKNGRYSNRDHVASFVGFFPYQDPRLLITVVVNEPELDGIGYGGRVAAPAFRNIAEKCIRYMAIPPQAPDDVVMPQSGHETIELSLFPQRQVSMHTHEPSQRLSVEVFRERQSRNRE